METGGMFKAQIWAFPRIEYVDVRVRQESIDTKINELVDIANGNVHVSQVKVQQKMKCLEYEIKRFMETNSILKSIEM